MAFLEDPRLRQRWNRIAHDAETVTENAAAGLFTFSQNYINPCFSFITDSIEQCTTVCLGDAEDRLRRKRERQRARHQAAEFSFDFYDDWYQDEQTGGLLGGWAGEDWDRLLAGTGAAPRHGGGGGGGEAAEQPRRKRGMSYGTRGARRKAGAAEDPTIIPSTQPIGFLSKLPWKMGGTLRYKPSAADLQDHPGRHGGGEAAPLLGGGDDDDDDDDSDHGQVVHAPRRRSGTTGSGGTSDSFRSRGDLFPSDEEGEEDAIPLADDVTYDMIKRDDRSSGRTRSSRGKQPAGPLAGSRTVSRSTLGSTTSAESTAGERTGCSRPPTPPDMAEIASTEDLRGVAARNQRREGDEQQVGPWIPGQQHVLERPQLGPVSSVDEVAETKPAMDAEVAEIREASTAEHKHVQERSWLEKDAGGRAPVACEDTEIPREPPRTHGGEGLEMTGAIKTNTGPSFHAARLPRFG